MFSGPDFAPIDAEFVSKTRFAELVGVTQGRVSQMIDMGLPVCVTGKINREAGWAWVQEHIRPRHSSEDGGDRARAKADRERHEAEIARMKVGLMAGRLIEAETVRLAAFERARMERDAHIGFASRLAATVANELGCDAGKAFAIIDREMRDHLLRLADTPLDIPGATT